MRVLAACSLGGVGHFNPLLPFLEAARRRGDETLVVGPPALAQLVDSHGSAFQPGVEPPEADVTPIREKLLVVSRAEALVLGNRELFGRLAATAMLAPMQRAYREWAPHLVLREPCEYASAVARPPGGALTAQVAISLAEAEAASIAAAAPVLEEHRAGLVEELWASPYLTYFPASLDPSPFPTTVRFRQGAPSPSEPLPAWWDRANPPLVYVSFGTVLGHMSIAAGAYRTALAAVEGLPARVLLTVGRSFDPSLLGPPPANVHVERWVDQADVLAEAAVVVCHGGSGTVFGALAAGVPLVIVPGFADQFERATRRGHARRPRRFDGEDPYDRGSAPSRRDGRIPDPGRDRSRPLGPFLRTPRGWSRPRVSSLPTAEEVLLQLWARTASPGPGPADTS